MTIKVSQAYLSLKLPHGAIEYASVRRLAHVDIFSGIAEYYSEKRRRTVRGSKFVIAGLRFPRQLRSGLPSRSSQRPWLSRLVRGTSRASLAAVAQLQRSA